MQITAIRFILCQHELATPIPLSVGVLTHRNFGLVEVETDAGLTGIGETSVNFPPWCIHERRATIEEGLGPMLIGQNPLEIGRLWNRMVDGTRGFTRMWGLGAIRQAISGIDIALWDIAGQHYGVPVHTLLGGSHRNQAECYAVGFSAAEPDKGATEIIAQGYRAVKIRIGFDDDVDVAKARATRAAIGPEVRLMIDANQAFKPPRALAMAKRLADLDLAWLEEPVINDDAAGYAALRQAVPSMRLAWGENACEPEEVDAFLEAGLVDVVMPDPCRCGGLTGAVEMCRIAHRYGVPFSPHHYGSDVGFAACLHLVASQPNFDIMLRDVAPVPLRDAIINEPIAIAGGKAAIADRPGLGVTLNRALVEKTCVAL
ncbi:MULTISPECIES: mandelate racemase/muconate lactonizing enzyme family protein [unclassified Roseitalea]|uniref:mandelate racemase/muconate lactonizing enzyme family protein n=1 Tax=unclassified Roseitalea TaxID=2639107 RepID=UPI00273FDB54|nr:MULTISPECIES: mandelate racemase/muconate lactonizing enzyme family protein [unclassified Roseitalea]